MSTLVQGLVQRTDGTIRPLRLTTEGAVVTSCNGEDDIIYINTNLNDIRLYVPTACSAQVTYFDKP